MLPKSGRQKRQRTLAGFPCRMCYIHKRANDQTAIQGELSASDWINYAKEAQKSGMLLLLLTGGEPLLRPDFREIYTACINLGILISINTNGTLIDESMVEFFKKNPPLRVNLTLYGASPEAIGISGGSVRTDTSGRRSSTRGREIRGTAVRSARAGRRRR